MGLYITYDTFTMSYGTFGAWRDFIRNIAGEEYDAPFLDKDNIMGIWDDEPDDILDVLMCHADNDGVIEARHVGPLADRLEGLVKQYEEKMDAAIKVSLEKQDLFYRMMDNSKIKDLLMLEKITTEEEIEEWQKRMKHVIEYNKEAGNTYSRDISITYQFIRGLRSAQAAGDKVEFR